MQACIARTLFFLSLASLRLTQATTTTHTATATYTDTVGGGAPPTTTTHTTTTTYTDTVGGGAPPTTTTHTATFTYTDTVGGGAPPTRTTTTTDTGNTPTCTGGCQFQLKLLTDRYPGETSWRVADATGAVLASGSTPDKMTEYEHAQCLKGGVHTFTIQDRYGDGICCSYGSGRYDVSVDGALVKTGGQFRKEESTTFSCGPQAPGFVTSPGAPPMTAPSDRAPTCGDVRSAFKKSGCCGSPSREFHMEMPEGRRLSGAGDITARTKAYLERIRKSRGQAAASMAAEKVGAVLEAFL